MDDKNFEREAELLQEAAEDGRTDGDGPEDVM